MFYIYPLRQKKKVSFFFYSLLYLFVNLARSLPFAYYKYQHFSLPRSLITTYSSLTLNRHLYSYDIIIGLMNSFGKRTPTNQYRINECVILEPSELLVVSSIFP